MSGGRVFDFTGPTTVYINTIDLEPITTRLDALEALMATAAEQITALSAKVDDIAADFAAFAAAMTAERENLTEAGQAALDAATAKLDALDVAVGDADGSDTPPVEPPVV
jgi:uncharacterized coiled-coil protein SlyX